MAATLASLPTAHITSLVGQVTSSAFAKLQNNLVELNKLLNGFTAGLALLNFPILAGMAVTAPELIPILLGSQWFAVIFPLQIMCATGFIRTVSPLLTQALTFAGKANVTAQYTSLCAVVIPVTVLIGVFWQGINGVAILLFFAYFILTVILLLLCKKHIEMNIRDYLSELFRPLFASVFMVINVLIIKLLLMDNVNTISLLIIEIGVGILTYAFWLIYVQKKALYQVQKMLKNLGVSDHKLSSWPFNRLNEK
jgi:O-antigen/teichoic acid export membrane protein